MRNPLANSVQIWEPITGSMRRLCLHNTSHIDPDDLKWGYNRHECACACKCCKASGTARLDLVDAH